MDYGSIVRKYLLLIATIFLRGSFGKYQYLFFG
jgi:hypothetical protein